MINPTCKESATDYTDYHGYFGKLSTGFNFSDLNREREKPTRLKLVGFFRVKS